MSVTEQLFVNAQPKGLAQLISRVASATGRPVTAFCGGWSFELPNAVPDDLDSEIYFGFTDDHELDFSVRFEGRRAIVEPGRGEPRDTVSGPVAAFLDFIENRRSSQGLFLERDWSVAGDGCGPGDVDDIRGHLRALETLLPAPYELTPDIRRRVRVSAARIGRRFDLARRPGLSPADFFECFVRAGTPVIVPAGIGSAPWWSLARLREIFANTYTHLSRYPDCSYSVDECLERIATGSPAAFKAALPLARGIREHYSIDRYFAAATCFGKAQALLIAPADSSMPPTYRATAWHRDWADNLLAELIGVKKVRIASPADEDRFGLCPTPACHYNVAVDHSAMDTRSPLEHVGIVVREAVLEPGDLLFIPCGWLHTVESLTPTASINCWRVRPPEMLAPIR